MRRGGLSPALQDIKINSWRKNKQYGGKSDNDTQTVLADRKKKSKIRIEASILILAE